MLLDIGVTNDTIIAIRVTSRNPDVNLIRRYGSVVMHIYMSEYLLQICDKCVQEQLGTLSTLVHDRRLLILSGVCHHVQLWQDGNLGEQKYVQ